VVDAAEAVEHDLRVRRQDGIRPKRPDLADELLAQREIVLERAVGLVEEGDALVADDRRGGRLLGLPQGGQLERIEVRILPAGVSARAADEPADRARVDPGASRGRLVRSSGGWAPACENVLARQVAATMMCAEASLVSPHERSLVLYPCVTSAPSHRACAP
jgi:hypothetical protein